MTYQLTKSQKEIQKAAREFAKGEFDKDLAYEMDKNQEFPQKIWKKAAELGFIGMHFPEKYSGGELDMLDTVLLAEEFCRKDSTIGGALMLSSSASECVLRFGSHELKEKYLPKVAEGKMLCGGAFTEPNADLGFNTLNTTATKDGDNWIINGEKSFVLNGSMAGFYCVLCQTESNGRTRPASSVIVVEGNQPGITVVDSGDKLGLRMTKTSGLKFEDVSVPLNQLVGKEGNGIKQVRATLDEGRFPTAQQSRFRWEGVDGSSLEALAREHRPRMIVAGFSAYSRVVDWKRMRELNSRWNACFPLSIL